MKHNKIPWKLTTYWYDKQIEQRNRTVQPWRGRPGADTEKSMIVMHVMTKGCSNDVDVWIHCRITVPGAALHAHIECTVMRLSLLKLYYQYTLSNTGLFHST